MKKATTIIVIALAALMVIGTVSAASGDQGRRLSGPFCVGKPGLTPLVVGNKKVIRAGVVRSIAASQTCNETEIRKFGVAVPHPEFPATAGPSVAGPAGEQGAKGDTGAAGKDGADSTVPGPKGDKGDPGSLDGTGVITLCVSNGGNVKVAIGKHDCDPGHDRYLVVTVPG